MTSDRPGSADASTDAATAVELLSGYEARPLSFIDAAAVADAYIRNREHLAPWEPARRPEFLHRAHPARRR